MSKIPLPAWACFAAMLVAFGFISLASAPGIQPGFGLGPIASEQLVLWTGRLAIMAGVIITACVAHSVFNPRR